MRNQCEVCSEPFESVRPKKTCSDRCRKRAQRRPGGTAAATAPAPRVELEDEQPTSPAVVFPISESDAGELETATLTDLKAAGRDTTPSGRAAIALARRIDAGSRETGSAFAALVRQHGATLALALEGAARAADPVDELRARREHKRNAG